MKLIRKFIFFVLLINFSFLNFAFEIDSTTFDQRIDTGGYKEYRIKNNSDKPIRYKINVTKPDNGKADMSKWVRVYPKVINIPPLQEGVLKVYAQSPKGAKEEEYFCNLLIKPLVIPKIYKTDNHISGNSIVTFSPIIELSGYVGDPNFNKNIDLKNLIFKKLDNKIKISGEVINNSICGVQFGIKILNKNKSLLGTKWIGYIAKDKSKTFEFFLEKINDEKEIEKILLYNADNLIDLKTINIKN